MVREHDYTRAIVKTLKSMEDYGPEDLLGGVKYAMRDTPLPIDESLLVDILTDPNVNGPERTDFKLLIAKWDAATDEAWIAQTEAGTVERRSLINSSLKFGQEASDRINSAHPAILSQDVFIADTDWDPWYTPERRREHSFYWDSYSKVLNNKLDEAAITAIDTATTNVVARLANPISPERYQAKGLVVGHVQSGKTANFTGVVAKAIDAGYRLIIVLTGTVELLRSQTQRRLDMELIGKENILGGRDENDYKSVADIDYASDDDLDWLSGKFVQHGVQFGMGTDVPAIRRLTGKSGDYKSLKHGLDALDFRARGELKHPELQLWDSKNLFDTDVRIAVVKKNKSVLTKLVQDLQNVRVRLDEIPTLIIDDEADQASVNTVKPSGKEVQERTAINGLIAKLLGELKRAQYVGYTATPFANVFVSPDDSEDIFPKDFILSLDPPPAYMGGKSFHDLDSLDEWEKNDPEYSNEAAFVRSLVAETEEGELAELREALDAFVLTGAIKLWREAHHPELGINVKHHTMLVHESVKQDEHRELAATIVREWARAGFSSPQGFARLRSLYDRDFYEISTSRDIWDAPLPADFMDLGEYVGDALDLITVSGAPVVVVNGAAEKDYEQVDFDRARVWRIMVGGTKLSRGFTVEGLTITYYRRRAMAADTLMQMGRWFGYRPGYKDLVRLYIARKAKGPRNTEFDLYEAFQAIVEDEEEFRDELKRFSGLNDDGEPNVRPIDVPPMVFQQLPWLRPTSLNKMYNAKLEFKGTGGQLQDFPRQPARANGRHNRAHFDAISPWLAHLGEKQRFEYHDTVREADGEFLARVVIVPAPEMIEVLSKFRWVDGLGIEPSLEIMRDAIGREKLEDWAVVVPYLGNPPVIKSVGGVKFPVSRRKRREDRAGFSGSSFRQRGAVERIAGKLEAHGGEAAAQLYRPTRGAMLLTFAADPIDGVDRDPRALPDQANAEDIATLFSLVLPKQAAPRGRIGFTVRNPQRGSSPIVDFTPN